MEISRESTDTLKDSNLKRPAHTHHEPQVQKIDFSYFNKKLSVKPVFNTSSVEEEISLKNEIQETEDDTSESLKYIYVQSETTKKAASVEKNAEVPNQTIFIKNSSRSEMISMIKQRFNYEDIKKKQADANSRPLLHNAKEMEVDKVNSKPNQTHSSFQAVPEQHPIQEISTETLKISSSAPQNSSTQKEPLNLQPYESYTNKYCPKTSSELLSNRSQADKLKSWLLPYSENSLSQWSKLTKLKVALISGPPGVGKTTVARMIPTSLKLRIIELNASDCRNKSFIQEKILPFVNNTSIISTEQVGKAVLIMDEIDGMSAGDEGGISALIECIKVTKVPIICICNDFYSSGIKSLKTYCYTIKFHKANERDTFKLVKQISEKEGLKLSEREIELVSMYSRGDFRFCLNILEFCRNKFFLTSEKDVMVSMNSFEIIQNLFCETKSKKFCLSDKVSMILEDYDFANMLIMENYIDAVGQKDLFESANALAFSDTIMTRIKQQQEWTLLTDFAHAELLSISNSIRSDIMISFPKATTKPKKVKNTKKKVKSLELEPKEKEQDLESILTIELSKLF